VPAKVLAAEIGSCTRSTAVASRTPHPRRYGTRPRNECFLSRRRGGHLAVAVSAVCLAPPIGL